MKTHWQRSKELKHYSPVKTEESSGAAHGLPFKSYKNITKKLLKTTKKIFDIVIFSKKMYDKNGSNDQKVNIKGKKYG